MGYLTCGLFVDAQGGLWMSAGMDGMVFKLDWNGKISGWFGKWGMTPDSNEIGEAHQLAVSKDLKTVYVADSINARVVKMERDCTVYPAFCALPVRGNLMLRKITTRFNVFVLILPLLAASVEVTRAQSLTISDAAIQAGSPNGRAGIAAALQPIRRRTPCNRRRRTLAGAGIGFVTGMILVNRAAAENNGTVDAKTTLAAGVYGGALGALIGLSTCR